MTARHNDDNFPLFFKLFFGVVLTLILVIWGLVGFGLVSAAHEATRYMTDCEKEHTHSECIDRVRTLHIQMDGVSR